MTALSKYGTAVSTLTTYVPVATTSTPKLQAELGTGNWKLEPNKHCATFIFRRHTAMIMMSNLLDESNNPIHLNSLGVRCVAERRYHAASHAFIKALKQAKVFMRKEETCSRLVSFLLQNPIKPSSVPNLEIKDKIVDFSSRGFVFTDPIIIEQHDVIFGERSSLLKFLLIIVFNIGLVHQIQSMQADSAECRSSLQATALRCYAYAYKVLVQERLELSVVFLMAILNNLGQIHSSEGDECKARACFRQLLQHLKFHRERSATCESPQELEGFFQNAMGAMLPAPIGARAA